MSLVPQSEKVIILRGMHPSNHGKTKINKTISDKKKKLLAAKKWEHRFDIQQLEDRLIVRWWAITGKAEPGANWILIFYLHKWNKHTWSMPCRKSCNKFINLFLPTHPGATQPSSSFPPALNPCWLYRIIFLCFLLLIIVFIACWYWEFNCWLKNIVSVVVVVVVVVRIKSYFAALFTFTI